MGSTHEYNRIKLRQRSTQKISIYYSAKLPHHCGKTRRNYWVSGSGLNHSPSGGRLHELTSCPEQTSEFQVGYNAKWKPSRKNLKK